MKVAAYQRYGPPDGKPVAFYSDKVSVFRINRPEPQGGDGVTQFGRALDDLNIDIICANSAPATLFSYGETCMAVIAHYRLATLVGAATGGCNGNDCRAASTSRGREWRW